VVKYIGSKRVLVPAITSIAARLPVASVADLFAGTTRVGQGLRAAGLRVLSNDTATYSEVFGRAYIEAGPEVDRERIAAHLRKLNALPGYDGYFTQTFCRESRFFQEHNGQRIDAIRDAIDEIDAGPAERALLLASLLEAADRVDSTCGLQMAYVKQWAPRSFNKLELRMPHEVDGPTGAVARCDANELAPTLADYDLAYVDPPYNQHSYFSNYHVWETLVRWDKPTHYGVACKREDCRTTKSAYNSKRAAWDALSRLIDSVATPWLIVSFSNEGFHEPEALEQLLAGHGHVRALEIDHKRYVGAQIGIHSPSGERVGEVSHLRNREHIFVVGPERSALDGAVDHVVAGGSDTKRSPDVHTGRQAVA
jgi:adenine-specific DNA-methyltransferase